MIFFFFGMIVLNSILNPEVTIIFTEPRGEMCDDVQERVPQKILVYYSWQICALQVQDFRGFEGIFLTPFFFFFFSTKQEQ